MRNSGLNWAPSAQPMTTCAAMIRRSGIRPSIQPRWPTAAAMNSGAISQALGERVRERSAATKQDTPRTASTGSHGATGTASSGFCAETPAREITRNGANTTMSATRVVCATMIGSSCPPYRGATFKVSTTPPGTVAKKAETRSTPVSRM